MRNNNEDNFIKMTILILALILMMFLVKDSLEVTASPNYFVGDPQIIRSTCYIDTGTTFSGVETRHGICAMKEEWIGCVAMLWKVEADGSIGDFIGYYEVLDTGGAKWLKNGTCIDIWCDGMKEVEQWQSDIGDYVYIKLYKGVG